jgi:Nif-specific regulatory protein
VEPVLEAITHFCGFEFATITLLSRQTGVTAIEAALGMSASQKASGRYRLGEGITGMVIQTGAPAIAASVTSDLRFLDRTGAQERMGHGRRVERRPDCGGHARPTGGGTDPLL